jgi:hypothetical protein
MLSLSAFCHYSYLHFSLISKETNLLCKNSSITYPITQKWLPNKLASFQLFSKQTHYANSPY